LSDPIQYATSVDIDEVYTAIVDRYSGEEHDFSNDDTNESSDSFDEIDDLFDRDNLFKKGESFLIRLFLFLLRH
jgi:hypothetical protein